MSAYSTIRITRARAYQMILEHLGGGASDEVLSRWLDDILRDKLYNARIVGDDEDNDHDRL